MKKKLERPLLKVNSMSDDKRGKLLVLLVILITLGFGYIAYKKTKNKIKFDEHTMCPLNKEYSNTVIIIDKSDKWSDSDSKRILNLINKIDISLELYERLTIKVIEPEGNVTTTSTYFDLCNPGNKANPLYENPRRILKRYRESFQKPLASLKELLIKPETSKTTPLLRVIRDELLEEKKNLRLIVISDFMEYSNEYNFYRRIPNVDELIDTFPKNSIKNFEARYIMRLRIKNKIYDSLNFFEELTHKLGGKFNKKEIIVIGGNSPRHMKKSMQQNIRRNSLTQKYKHIKSNRHSPEIETRRPSKKSKFKKQMRNIYFCKASSKRATGWAKKVGIDLAKHTALRECEKRRVTNTPCRLIDCYMVR